VEVLSKELAESIVNRTMNVVNYNINIMNENGIIIASGNKDRIGTVHEGAIIALQRKSEFNVDKEQTQKLNGVHPGTNLVIEFKNKIVGVIGITGEPKDVLGYGKLIKMTAEMMIEQVYVMKELEWNNRMKEEMMLSLIYNKQDSFPLLEEYTKKLKIPYDHPMVIFIIEINSKYDYKDADLNVLNNIISLLEGTFKESWASVVNSKMIVLLHKFSHNYSKIIDYKEISEEVGKKIHKQMGINVKVSIGKIYDKLLDMHKSFDVAKETLLFGKNMYPNENIYIFDLLKSDMLFSQNNTKWKTMELQNTYELMVFNDKSGELRETLRVLIEENGELNNVANRLFIHRNTLSYRLNKIYKLTNKNPRKYIDLFWLYSAMINFEKR
jgi:carbohydrate diacid regulator